MGYLATVGILMAISLAIGVIGAILGLWLGHIIFFDSIVLGIVAGICSHHFAHIHTALCIVIGIGVCILLLVLQNTMVGFWLIGGIFTLLYAAFFGFMAIVFSSGDMIWGWVVFGIAFVVTGSLHLKARNNEVV